jgi:hypothetical protein
MLFDLIKCHAALRFLQREGKEADDEVRIEAAREDFDAAARLYAAINQDGGGQESKMTRNEAAALATIARMGWETFTVRMLQQATGLSYHQVRRILQGYTAKGTVYCGLLEKCPAISMVDATVIDESTGTTVRRHESHFQFDAERYREWVAELAVWLEDEDEGEEGSPPPSDNGCNDGCNDGCKQGCKGGCKEIEGGSSPQNGEIPLNDEDTARIGAGDPGSFATISGSHSSSDPASLEEPPHRVHHGSTLCVSERVANEKVENDDILMYQKMSSVSKSIFSQGICNPLCNPLCNRVAKVANAANGVQPLAGILDPRTFGRVRVELGRCTICGAKAVYHSAEAQTQICEGCYARLIREENARKGIR